jgi:dUTP pyrophosphatase
MSKLNVQIIEDGALAPTKMRPTDAGFDLYANECHVLGPMEICLISTGIGIAIDLNHFGRVCGRSGLSSQGLFVYPGVIDSSYRGTVKIIVQNLSREPLVVEKRMRIAQLIIIPHAAISSVNVCAQLPPVECSREYGFGSSGIY